MNLIFLADEKLITRVAEPIAWRVQYRYGKDNFDLAKMVNDISSMALLTGNLIVAIKFKDATMGVLGSFCAWNIWKMSHDPILHAAKLIRKNPQMLNPGKDPSMQLLRIVLFWFFMPFMGIIFGNVDSSIGTWTIAVAFIVGQFVQAYFTTCNPMPPKWQAPKEEKLPNALPQLG